MSTLGRWSAGVTTLDPTTSFAAPNGLFGTEDRNDGSVYSFADSTATLTLPSSDLADGYLIIARLRYDDDGNGRCSIAGRIQQTGGTGNFVNGQTGGYQRNTANAELHLSCFGFIDNPSASSTFQFQWESESDTPTGGTVKSTFDVIPFFYSDIGMYDGTDLGLYGGTTRNIVTIGNTVLEGTNITRTANVVTVTGDNKRYFIISSQWYQNRGEPATTRTQRIFGHDYDGSADLSAQGYGYYRQGTADGTGSHIHDIIETVTASRTIEMTCYRGDGIANGDGGADLDGQAPTQGRQALVIIELNDSAECFRTHDATGAQSLESASPLDLNATRTTDFIDAASWVKIGTVGMENNAGVLFDALTGANLWAAATDVTSGTRGIYEGMITVDGVEDINIFDGNYIRGNQGSEDTFAWGSNPIGFVSLADNVDLGVSTTSLGGAHAVDTNASTVGMWGINLDTLDGGVSGAIIATPDIVISATADLNAQGKLDASLVLAFSAAADLNASGKLDAPPFIVFSAAADLQPIARLNATPDLAFSQTADLNAIGKLDATASLIFSAATALLRGTGLLAATAAMTFSAAADLTFAANQITASTSMAISATADLEATGKLDATPDLVFSTAADLKGLGTLDATSALIFSATADLKGEGLLNSTSDLVFSATADLEASGKLDASSVLVFSAIADLNALGTLDTTSDLVFSITVDLEGSGKLDASPALVFSATADLEDATTTGPIDASTALVFSATADLKGQGKLDAISELVFSAAASLGGGSEASATPDLVFSATADLNALGELDASPDLVFSATADLNALGKVDSSPALVFSFTADLNAIGKLDATPALVFSTAANLIDATPPGDVTALSLLVISTAADLNARGKLDVTPDLVFSATADLTLAVNQILASPSMAFTGAADLKSDAQLSALSILVFSQTANLVGPGILNSTPSMIFNVIASITDGAAIKQPNIDRQVVVSLINDEQTIEVGVFNSDQDKIVNIGAIMADITGLPIERKRGDFAPDRLVIMDAANPDQVLDITSFTYLLTINTVRDPDPSVPYGVELLQISGAVNGPIGEVVFNWTAMLSDQAVGQYWYDVQQTDASGTIKTIIKNKYTFHQDITK